MSVMRASSLFSTESKGPRHENVLPVYLSGCSCSVNRMYCRQATMNILKLSLDNFNNYVLCSLSRFSLLESQIERSVQHSIRLQRL